MKKHSLRLFAGAFLILPGIFSLLYFGVFHSEMVKQLLPLQLTGNDFVDGKLNYQIITMVVAVVILLLIRMLAPGNAKQFYRVGTLDAPTEPVKWLGIKPSDRWKSVGINFAVIVSLATGIFIYVNLLHGRSVPPGIAGWIPMILLLSAMNAFTEESITRLSVVTLLDGLFPRQAIYLSSALLFGIPHYFGVPGGLIGSLMAGFLGWLLAKSIMETRGFFWAWFIHFLQDVIIISGLFIQYFQA